VDDLRRATRKWSKNAKGSVPAISVRCTRVTGADERISASNAGGVSVARARIKRSARQKARLKDGPCVHGYVGIV
jgi:hypothetical protein